jgi:hypothetical protein
MQKEGDQPIRCSFCSKAANDVRKLIAGPTVFICDECVELCVDIIADDFGKSRLASYSAEEQKRSDHMVAALGRAVACSLCGRPASANEVLAIGDRGVLCGECADAIEDALGGGTPKS